MATIASLLIRIGADATNIRSTLNRTARDLQQFARNASRLKTTDVFGNLPLNLNKNVSKATKELNRLRQNFAVTMDQLRAKAAEGTINERKFFREGQRAEEAFNKGILSARAKFATGNRSPAVDTRISAGLLSQLKTPSGPIRDLTHQLSVVGDLTQSLGRNLTRGLTLPAVAFGVAGAKAAGDFQSALNRAGALIDDSAGKMDVLAKAAQDFSQVTPFSPTEIVKGMQVLGQAGQKTNEVLATLPGILRLATIESVPLDQAVETVVRGMTSLGLKTDATSAFVDKLAKASLSGVVNMTELGDAFKYAATVAAQSGQPLNDILALITKLAQGGLAGETGGTSLRNILISLTDTTPKAEKALARVAKRIGQSAIAIKDLDGSVTGVKGKFLPLTVILEQFARANLTAGEAVEIFGRRGGPGFAVLLQQSIPEIVKLSAAIDNAGGTAEKVVGQQFTGLNASLTLLKNSFIALAISVGNSGLLGFLTSMVNSIKALVDQMSRANPQMIITVAKWIAWAAVMGPMISILGGVVRAVSLLRIAIFGLTATGALAALTPAGIIGLVIIGLGLLAKAFLDTAEDTITAQQALDTFKTSLSNLTGEELANVVASYKGQLAQLKAARDAALKTVNAGRPKSEGVVSRDFIDANRAYNRASDELKRLNPLVTEMENKLGIATTALEEHKKATDEAEKSAKAFETQMRQLRESLKNATSAEGFGVDKEAQIKELVKKIRNVTDNLNVANTRTKGLEDREQQLLGPLEEARQLWKEITDLIDDVGAGNVDAKVKEGATRLKAAIDRASAPDPNSFEPWIRSVDNVLARIDAVKDSTDNVAQRARLLAPLYAELNRLQAEGAQKIKAQGGIYAANIRLVQKFNQILRQQQSPDLLRDLVPDIAAQVDVFARRFEEAKQALAVASAAKNEEGVRAARAVIDGLNIEAASLIKLTNTALAQINDPSVSPEDKTEAFKQLLQIFQQLGVILNGIDLTTQKWLENIHDIVNAFDAVNHVIDQIGRAINKDVSALTDMVDGVADVIAGIGDIKAAKDELGKFDLLKAIPGIGGAIGGGIQALSSLGKIFGIGGGPSAGSKLQQENTQALRDLRRQLAENLREAGQQSAVAAALRQANFANAQKTPGPFGSKDILRGVLIDQELKKFGVSLEDAQRLAEEFGISLKDEKGRFRKSGFEALDKALEESGEALRHFSKNIDTQLSITSLKQRLETGKPVTPDQELTNQLNALLGAVGPGVAKFLQGIDTTTEQGRQKLRKALLSLITAIENGQIQFGDLGQFENADQLLEWIDKLTGSMENLDDQVNASSQNIPNGFKLMLRQFQADLPERLGPDPIHGPTFDPVKIDPMTTAIVDSQKSAGDKIVAAIEALGGKPVANVSLSQASPVGPNIDTGSAAMVDVLNTLVNVNKASEAGIRGVEDAVTALASVFKEINDTDAAASFRGIQENILRNRTETFDAGTETGDAISGDKIMNITQTFDININGTDKTAREQWKNIKQIAREESQRRYGTPHRWGEVP